MNNHLLIDYINLIYIHSNIRNHSYHGGFNLVDICRKVKGLPELLPFLQVIMTKPEIIDGNLPNFNQHRRFIISVVEASWSRAINLNDVNDVHRLTFLIVTLISYIPSNRISRARLIQLLTCLYVNTAFNNSFVFTNGRTILDMVGTVDGDFKTTIIFLELMHRPLNITIEPELEVTTTSIVSRTTTRSTTTTITTKKETTKKETTKVKKVCGKSCHPGKVKGKSKDKSKGKRKFPRIDPYEALLHAMSCGVENCSFVGCQIAKRQIEHSNDCSEGNCFTCRQAKPMIENIRKDEENSRNIAATVLISFSQISN